MKIRRRWIVAIGTTAVLAGCSLVSPGPIVATLPGGEGFRELPVALSDPDNLVLRVAPGTLDGPFGGPAEVDVVDADTAVVRWLGGACDTRVRLRLSLHERQIGIGLHTDEPGGNCVAAGINRAVSITFQEPIADRSIVLAAAP
jgi:hypothetical protein